ncbi:fatty acid-binding protein-like [Haliotis rufescens]|uniref:fatty acid-binding protein-like n=1 Tax=Haliotis rufescens TaxID=6454 RepID=UPI001EAFCBCB|nr:fatty acid-binding protein-like [Haliotis rufescens]
MEKFVGKWEVRPELTQNFDAFSDTMEIPAEKRELYKNMQATYTFALDGSTLVARLETKGFNQELRFQLGVPLSYKSFDGSSMTSCINMKGGHFVESHKMEKDGTTREWTTDRCIEGDYMVGVQTKDGVSMTTKLKRL